MQRRAFRGSHGLAAGGRSALPRPAWRSIGRSGHEADTQVQPSECCAHTSQSFRCRTEKTRTAHGGRACSRVTPEEIAARIAASKARRAARQFITCPACGIGVASAAAMLKHMRDCCRDLLDEPAWQQAVSSIPGGARAAVPPAYPPLERLMREARAREDHARDAVLHWTFRSGHVRPDGRPVRYSPAEVSARLGLPVARVSRLLTAAMRAVPLVADSDPVRVLHECEHFLVVDKPPGVQTAPVHRYKGGSMLNRVLGLTGQAPHVIHSLDMDTSGVLLFAKDSAVVPGVHLQFRRRQVAKMYACIAVGCPSELLWHARQPIGPHPVVTVARVVPSDGSPSDGGDSWQAAHTTFMRLQSNPNASLAGGTRGLVCYDQVVAAGLQAGGASLVAAQPHTGRTHQIRVHMAAAGHPLVGDELYGLTGPWINRQALHATRLRITHPLTQQPLTFAAPLPDDFLTAAETLGLGVGHTNKQALEQAVECAWGQLGLYMQSTE